MQTNLKELKTGEGTRVASFAPAEVLRVQRRGPFHPFRASAMTKPISTEQLLGLRHHLSIVHQLPGRIRFRVALSLLDRSNGIDLGSMKGILSCIHGLRDIRINPAAATVVIEYDPTRLASSLWEALVNGGDQEALGAIDGLLGRTPREGQTQFDPDGASPRSPLPYEPFR